MLNPNCRLLPYWLRMSAPCATTVTIRETMAIISALDNVAHVLAAEVPSDQELPLVEARQAIVAACIDLMKIAEAVDAQA